MSHQAAVPYHRKDDIEYFQQAVSTMIDGAKHLTRVVEKAAKIAQRSAPRRATKGVKCVKSRRG
jgi:hypothetical protein